MQIYKPLDRKSCNSKTLTRSMDRLNDCEASPMDTRSPTSTKQCSASLSSKQGIKLPEILQPIIHILVLRNWRLLLKYVCVCKYLVTHYYLLLISEWKLVIKLASDLSVKKNGIKAPEARGWGKTGGRGVCILAEIRRSAGAGSLVKRVARMKTGN